MRTRPASVLRALALVLGLLVLGGATPAPAPGPVAPATAPPKFAGTYRIEPWPGLEARGFYHFFYLQPGGSFLLGAEWPGKETSRAAGTWTVAGDHLSLTGRVRVQTNQGAWRADFRRTYRISVAAEGIRLAPILEKNRYGLLGWPNAYRFHRTAVAPNLPGGGIPTDPLELLALIRKIAGE